MSLRIMRLDEVKKITGLSKASIYRFEKNGDFPKKVNIGKRSIGWFESDVEEFLLALKETNDSG